MVAYICDSSCETEHKEEDLWSFLDILSSPLVSYSLKERLCLKKIKIKKTESN